MAEISTAPAATPEATLELLEPEAITVRNVRKPDADMVDSIRRHNGNHTPIGVIRTADGELVLRFGGRRLQACKVTGHRVLATVIDGVAGTPDAEIERIFEQLDENDSRKGLTAADHANAVQELFSHGATVARIAANTGLSKKEIADARTVAASETARAIAAQYPLDLHQAAAAAEFEGDKPTVHALVEAAAEGPVRFAHRLQDARDAAADRQAIDAHIAKLEERGLVATRDGQHWEYKIERWTDGGRQLTPDTHKDCPGNLVHVGVYRSDHESHETWYCADPAENGHKLYRAPADNASASAKPKDEAAADRAKVIAGNKAWNSAETVRRDWLREFFARPKAPNDAVFYVLEALARSDARLTRFGMDHRTEGQHATARDLLGLAQTKGTWQDPPEVYTAMTTAGPDRRPVIALAIVLGAYEGSTGVHCWRNPAPEVCAYLEALEGWGYQLSDIERELVATARQRMAAKNTAAEEKTR